MDNERLTPYLRRRCLALNVEDRVALLRSLQESLTDSARTDTDRLDRLGEAMEGLTGFDVRTRTRLAEYVRARVVYAFTARMEGFSQMAVAKWLGLDHSTVHHLERRMNDALSMPSAFKDYVGLYNQFTSVIL